MFANSNQDYIEKVETIKLSNPAADAIKARSSEKPPE